MVTVSEDLYQAGEMLRRERKYRSMSEYVQGLIRYDPRSHREHFLTAEWAALNGYERDALDAALLRQVKTGKGIRGSWLEARISAAIKAHVAETGTVPTVQEVAKRLAKELPTTDDQAA